MGFFNKDKPPKAVTGPAKTPATPPLAIPLGVKQAPSPMVQKPPEPIPDKVIAKAPKSLPELKLTEIKKSAQRINENYRTKKLESLRPWNNYTITTIEGWPQIKIFDENGSLVEHFGSPLSDRGIPLWWGSDKIKSKIGRRYISDNLDNRTQPDVMMLDKVPVELRAFARKTLKDERRTVFEPATQRSFDLLANETHVVLDKYIVMSSKEDAFFAYITKNEKGITVPPSEWKRLNPEDTMPAELTKEVEKFLGRGEGYKNINQTHYALITDVGINVFKAEEAQESPLFAESIPSVGRNIVTDPSNPNVIYYCQSDSPGNILRLDLSGEANTWKSVAVELPKKYDSIRDLQLDPTGNFFLFYSGEDLVFLSKDTLDEVRRVSNLTNVVFDSSGNIRAVDNEGYLVIFEANFSILADELDKRRIANLAEGIDVAGIFDLKAQKKAEEQKRGEGFEELELVRTKYEQEFSKALGTITTDEGIQQLRKVLKSESQKLIQRGLKQGGVAYIISGLETLIMEREREFATKECQEAIANVRSILAIGLSISSLGEARSLMEKVKATEALLEGDLLRETKEVEKEFNQKSLELILKRGGEIIKDINGIIEGARTELDGLTSLTEMDEWIDKRYPQIKESLAALARIVPGGADATNHAINAARVELQKMADKYEKDFKEKYAKIREKASEIIKTNIELLANDIDSLSERLINKNFSSRKLAEKFLSTSDAYKALTAEIDGLAGKNPDEAKILERSLKVKISNALTSIERKALIQVAETGQQMESFGQVDFPLWEAKVKEKGKYSVELTFMADAGTKGANVYGDIGILIRTASGKVEKIGLYENFDNEDDWRHGQLTRFGLTIPPSYVSVNDAAKIRKEYLDWGRGEKSNLRKEFQEKRDALKELYSRRQKIGERTPEADNAWQVEYKAKLNEYAEFAAERHISLLRRIDQIKAQPEIEYTNGKGTVPKWQNDWTRDEQTEKYLEEMAIFCKKQLSSRTGLLMLRGHAGSGKDVLVDMFCQTIGRPKFTFNCTKWTAEADLSEDWTLEAREGATQAIKIPSALLSGIQTPGAVIYLNEFSAMPIPAQIFLHSLADAKREMVLKSESGRIIKADPTVLIIASENPGYPETNAPQFATESRFDILEVEYPPLLKDADASDPNKNEMITSSEARRIATSVSSLIDFTLEKNLKRSTFDDVWDSYINGLKNNTPELSAIQKFDLDVILFVVQYGNKLRNVFTNIFEHTLEGRKFAKDFPATQPITGREMRSCAYWLDSMPDEEKVKIGANPEKAAREFLEKSYLRHILDREGRRKIAADMEVFTSKKRVGV
ncbi:MAG TPA: AAA family ATPase [Candidatus Paceibacterota bacterium]|nr:AAA family ATPase [Candidatus Paceibacterota bacterium]